MNWVFRNRNQEVDMFNDLEKMRRDWARFFDADTDNSGLFDRSLAPATDLIEHSDGYTLYVDLPGVDKKDLDLNVENNVLSLKGEKKDKDQPKGFFRKENWTGSFRRTISLPQGADSEKVSANLKNGILTVTIGKREELKPRQVVVTAH